MHTFDNPSILRFGCSQVCLLCETLTRLILRDFFTSQFNPQMFTCDLGVPHLLFNVFWLCVESTVAARSLCAVRLMQFESLLAPSFWKTPPVRFQFDSSLRHKLFILFLTCRNLCVSHWLWNCVCSFRSSGEHRRDRLCVLGLAD